MVRWLFCVSLHERLRGLCFSSSKGQCHIQSVGISVGEGALLSIFVSLGSLAPIGRLAFAAFHSSFLLANI